MLEKYCDILVVGTELTGLITSAFLAKRGLSIFVLPMLTKHKRASSIEPHCFFPLNSLQLKSVLGRLGISEEELPKKPTDSVPLQIILPNHRIDVSTYAPLFEEELNREFPDKKTSVLGLYQALDDYRQTIDQEKLEELFLPENFWDRYKLKRLIEDYQLDHNVGDFLKEIEGKDELIAFFESQLRHVSDAFTQNPFLYQIAKFISLSEKGFCVLEGGIDSLKRLLLQRIAEYGGEILDPHHIETLAFERSYLSRVVMNGFEGTIHPRYALWNRPLLDLAAYLPNKFRFRRFTKRLEQLKPTHYRFCVQFSVPKAFFPVGMHHQVLLVGDPTKPLEAENCLYIQREANDREDLYNLSVHYLLAAASLEDRAERFYERHERIRGLLLMLMPFTNTALHICFPLPHKTGDPLQATLFPLDKEPFEIFLEAAKLHPVYEQKTDRFIDLFSLDFRTPANNLFLCSPELLIHFGLDGKVILAKQLSKLLKERLMKQKEKALRKKRRMI